MCLSRLSRNQAPAWLRGSSKPRFAKGTLPSIQSLFSSSIHRLTEVKKVDQVGKVPIFVVFCEGFEFDQIGKVGQLQSGWLAGCGQVFEVLLLPWLCLPMGEEIFETQRHRGHREKTRKKNPCLGFLCSQQSLVFEYERPLRPIFPLPLCSLCLCVSLFSTSSLLFSSLENGRLTEAEKTLTKLAKLVKFPFL